MDKNKKHLRHTLRQQRNQLSPSSQQQAAEQISKNVLALPPFQHSQHIAFYIAHDGEVNPSSILEYALATEKNCYLPVLTDEPRQLQFYRYHTNDPLIKSRFGIDEPDTSKQARIAAEDLDLVLLPLVACDNVGNRVGRGAGYYDHSFAFSKQQDTQKPLLIGLAYDFQKINTAPSKSWDVPLHILITNKNIYTF